MTGSPKKRARRDAEARGQDAGEGDAGEGDAGGCAPPRAREGAGPRGLISRLLRRLAAVLRPLVLEAAYYAGLGAGEAACRDTLDSVEGQEVLARALQGAVQPIARRMAGGGSGAGLQGIVGGLIAKFLSPAAPTDAHVAPQEQGTVAGQAQVLPPELPPRGP